MRTGPWLALCRVMLEGMILKPNMVCFRDVTATVGQIHYKPVLIILPMLFQALWSWTAM